MSHDYTVANISVLNQKIYELQNVRLTGKTKN